MVPNPPINDEEAKQKQEAFFERAQRGVLKHLVDKGGELSLGELHEYSLNKYLIQHQRFSQMMETFVDGGLVVYDQVLQKATITASGREFASN